MTGKKTTVGKRFTRRDAVEFEGGALHVRLDPLARFAPADIKAAAIEALESDGIPARFILAEHPGGSALRDHVLNLLSHEPDSRVGIACQICEQCIRIEQLPTLGAPSAMLMAEAYRLGQLVMIGKVYGIEAEELGNLQRKGADARRVYTATERDHWRSLFATDYPSHSHRRAAELIRQKLSLPAEAFETIRRALAKKSGKSL